MTLFMAPSMAIPLISRVSVVAIVSLCSALVSLFPHDHNDTDMMVSIININFFITVERVVGFVGANIIVFFGNRIIYFGLNLIFEEIFVPCVVGAMVRNSISKRYN